jgi:8-amino-7-oxononanoate synthase
VTAIAIVGMGCRFAGAEDLSAYWRLTRDGRDAFGPIPTDRWPAELFFDKNKRAVDKTYAPAGAFMKDIRSFPAIALGLPPRRVEVMDPQQRLALEVALDAVEDAGYRPEGLPRRTGVFMGITAQEFRSLAALRVGAVLMAAGAVGRRDLTEADVHAITAGVERIVPSRPYTAPGGLGNMSAAIIAQELDLHGPAYTTDAACASAHMAVFDAVQQLRTGVIDAAIAGGAYVQILPDHYVVFSRIGAMSAQGLCLPFDARADGFVQGDGAGVVLLKRLEDAVRDGDRIYAVIRGVAINNDGRGDGPMAPNQVGQTEVIREAYADAGLDPSVLGYHEAHGTGTSVGDPTEFAGIVQAVGTMASSVAIGSSKANVGHTMSAAGVAGLIRAVLAIHHKTIPPMANFQTPREDVRLDGSPFRIPTKAEPWSAELRVAGVSSFGFGGTNGHIVVANLPEVPTMAPAQPELVLLSAADEGALRALATRTARALEADPHATVAGVARAWAGRRRQPARLGVVARTVPELAQALAAYGAGDAPKSVRTGLAAGPAPRIAFLYPGQGAQRTGMLRGARARFPTLAAALSKLESDLSGSLARPLTHLLYPELRPDPVSADQAEAELTDTEHCQPALLAVGLALTAVLAEVGVQPSVVTGHSLGEFVAAAAAGVLEGGSAARFVAARGRAMAALPGDHGGMAAILADRETTEGFLVDGAVIANINHPRQLVVSGYSDAVSQVVARAERAGVKAVPLQVSHGFHGPALAGLDSAPFLDGIDLHDPKVTVASGISAEPYRDAAHAREVFLRHATSPVDFVRALEQCREAGADLYLQVGAGGPLAAFARGVLPRDHRGIYTLAGREDDDDGASLLDTLAQLWVVGVDIDVRPMTAAAPLPSLPPSVLPREDYWPVKEDPQLPVELPGIRTIPRSAAPAPAPPVLPEVAGPSAAAPANDDVESTVLAIIAKVSAYPREALRIEMSLVDDLGFDSLMVNDMATGLADAFPAIDGIPQELLINRPSVRDIVAFARNASAGVTERVAHDDDAPLTAWAVGWRPAPLPDLPGRTVTPAHRVLVVGDGAVATAWQHAGAQVEVTTAEGAESAGPVDILVWAVAPGGPGPGAVLAGEATAPDVAAPLIAALAAQARAGAHPDLLVVCLADDPWSGALCGIVRSLPREWPGASATALHLHAERQPEAGPLSLGQWASADRTPDVLHAESRWIPDLRPTPWAADPIGPHDVVLITGGTRGIGLAAARRVIATGARAILAGRGAPSADAGPLLASGRAVAIAVDVLDTSALTAALAPHGPVTRILHAAGVLADGPVETVSAATGAVARHVKVQGLLSALRAAGPSVHNVVVLGSWAGRFGNRHQLAYAAANAAVAGLAPFLPTPVAVLEFGPWSSSDMAATIPAPVQAAMRAEGVDFVGDEAGQEAIAGAWGLAGVRVLGRTVPDTTRATESKIHLSTTTHPYLLDHAIGGVPVLPLAAATDLMAWAAGLSAPFQVEDVRLFQGVTVAEPVELVVSVRGDRAEIRFAGRGALAYRARVRRGAPVRPAVEPLLAGGPPSLPLSSFYAGITFHGPLLQGITAIDAVSDGGIRGRVRVGSPRAWEPAALRQRFYVDPLVLDSAMQLSGYAAWVRYHRAGTPVGIGQLSMYEALPDHEVIAEVRFGDVDGDRFSGTVDLRHPEDGRLLARATEVVAELRQVEGAPEIEEPLELKPEWTDPSRWKEVQDLENRLAMAAIAGIRNPYFRVQEGTARDTTVIEGREYINFSSYNYVGFSGDPRVLESVDQAVRRYGTSVSASRVASGERPFHGDLERLLAQAQRSEDALLFTAGHATNVTTIGHLFGPEDLIVHDAYIHDSGLQGIRLSGAARRGFAHDDPDACEAELKKLRRHYRRCLILVEGVYSMDGDIAKVPAYAELKRRYGCLLMVDEAHSFGIIGQKGLGVADHFDLRPGDVDLYMGTLSKSLASCGGWIAATKKLIQYLRYTAPGFVFSAGLTPANGVAALRSMQLLLEEPWRVHKLQSNAAFFQKRLASLGVDTGPAHGESGVVPAITGNSMWALQLSQRLVDAGINVQPIVYPAVPDDAARLRFFLSSTHSEAQLAHTADTTAATLDQVRLDFPLPKKR